MALFDAVVNNTDRKGSHILPVRACSMPRPTARRGGELRRVHLFGVDHGVCFSVDPKLRTVLWAWRGTPIEPAELAVLRRLRAGPRRRARAGLDGLLDDDEVAATRERLDGLLAPGPTREPSPTGRPSLAAVLSAVRPACPSASGSPPKPLRGTNGSRRRGTARPIDGRRAPCHALVATVRTARRGTT